MVKKSVEKSGNIVINAKAVKISNPGTKKKKNNSNSIKQKQLNNQEIQLALLENFVNMQKVLTNLTIKFEMLSDNMNKLLQLFEISAKSFLQKNSDPNAVTDEKELLKKLDIMLDQNKTVAKGITLIEEKIRHRIYGDLPKSEDDSIHINQQKPRPLPRL